MSYFAIVQIFLEREKRKFYDLIALVVDKIGKMVDTKFHFSREQK
jgi:hypothetical protein